MILTLYTEGHFSAAHRLDNYEGKCAKLHGHTWKISVWARGEQKQLGMNGILWDFGNIRQLIAELDHKELNQVLPANPTAENLALFAYNYFNSKNPGLEFLIRIYENPIQPLSYCEVGDFTHV